MRSKTFITHLLAAALTATLLPACVLDDDIGHDVGEEVGDAAEAEDAAAGAPGPIALACTRFVSPAGSDAAAGTSTGAPWRTLAASLPKLRAGDTLCLRGGTYAAPRLNTLPKGTSAARITVQPHGSERPTVLGATLLRDPDYWTIRGLEWTAPGSTDRIVTILAGTGWVFEGNDVHNGAYAGLLVGKSTYAGPPHDHTIRGNTIHDTGAVNFYYNPGRQATGGLIERNLFFNAGTENLKAGWGGHEVCTGSNFENFGVGEVTIRYNTLHNAKIGSIIIAEPGGVGRVDVTRNLMTGQPRYLVRYDSVEGCLGERVYVTGNAGGLAPRFSEDFGHSPVNRSHEAGNVFPIDPKFDSTTASGFHPTHPAAQAYGRYAP